VFRAIMKYVTNGVLNRGVSSLRGIMRDQDSDIVSFGCGTHGVGASPKQYRQASKLPNSPILLSLNQP